LLISKARLLDCDEFSTYLKSLKYELRLKNAHGNSVLKSEEIGCSNFTKTTHIKSKLSPLQGRQLLSGHELQTRQRAIHHVTGLFIA
jgi:hypothetical protein